MLLLCSEFFTKGPRPRKKDQEKSIEGAERIELTESCNHVARSSDVNIVDAISADRTPPPSVGAHACLLANVDDENGSISEKMHDRPPPSVRQHVINVMHDCNDVVDGISHDDASQGLVPLRVSHSQTEIVWNERTPGFDQKNLTDSPEIVFQNGSIDGSELSLQTEPKESSTLKSEAWNPGNQVPRLILESVCNNSLPMKLGDCRRESRERKTGVAGLHKSNTEQFNVLESEMIDHTPDWEGPSKDTEAAFLNNEVDDTDDVFEHNTMANRKSSGSLKNMLQEYFDKKWSSSAKEKISYAEHVDEGIEKEQVPLLRKNNSSNQIQNIQRPLLSSTKSHSLDHRNINGYETDFSLTGSRTYSDESLGKTQSVRSHTSGRSRMSNLSISNGPSVSIEPSSKIRTDMNQNTIPKVRKQNYIPDGDKKLEMKRLQNLSNVIRSSFETETSTAPSTSVSCESLSPRSLPSETSDNSTADRLKQNQMEKSGRNIAMDSLKRVTPRKELNEEWDSGLSSEYKNGHANHPTGNIKSPKTQKIQYRKPYKSLQRHQNSPTVIIAHHDHHNGGTLVTPFDFQNGKSESEI